MRSKQMDLGNAQFSGVAGEASLVPNGFIDTHLVDLIYHHKAPRRTQYLSVTA